MKLGRTRVARNTRTEVIDQDNRLRQGVEADAAAEIKAEMDDILDQIDEALEGQTEYAEQIVSQFVQKGGE